MEEKVYKVYCVFECMNGMKAFLVKIFDQKKYALCFVEAQQHGDFIVEEWEIV